jgi:acetyl esterase/lipase
LRDVRDARITLRVTVEASASASAQSPTREQAKKPHGRRMHPLLYRRFIGYLVVTYALKVFFGRLLRGPADPSWSLPFEVAVDVSRRYMRHGFGQARAGLAINDAPVPRDPMLASRVALQREELAGLRTEVHTPRDHRPEHGTLLYFHGGGYISCSPRTHRNLASRIAWHGRVRVLVPRYPKAPEHPFPAALDSAVACFEALLASGTAPERVLIGGDSAGGGLALALLLRLREAGAPLPRAAVLLSPWVDLTGSGQSLTSAKLDILDAEMIGVSSALYAGGASLEDPLISPLYADLSGLPPVLVQTGEHEIFHSENHQLVERLRAAGVEVEHEVSPAMTHVFQSLAMLSGAGQAAVRSIGRFVRKTQG